MYSLRMTAVPKTKRVTYAGFLRRDLSVKRRLRAKKLTGELPTTARGSEEGGAKCVATVHIQLLRII